MKNDETVRMIRGIGYYLPKAMKFYNLKSEHLAPVIFLITLIFYFINGYIINRLLPNVMTTINEFIKIPNSELANVTNYSKLLSVLLNSSVINLIMSIITNFLVGIFTSIFLITCIKELKGEEFTLKNGFRLLANKFFKIAISSLLFSLAYNILKIFFVIPGFIYYTIYIFYMCYALDLKKRVAGAFEASKEITKGHRMEIFSVVILFKIIAFISVNFVTLFILSFITSILSATNNNLVEIFVSAFMSSIIYLMEIKLVALIYFDIEYGWKPVEKL